MKNLNGKIKTKKPQIIKLSLSEKDFILLDRYARLHDMTKKTAVKRIVKDFLSANVSMPEDISKNQLDLFTSRETDLFDYTR
ncbi:MAG: hypothetical protein J6P44_03580 [Bacteroidales bacterium]|nr:hypothetical protein [Bacteroidales bacterium]